MRSDQVRVYPNRQGGIVHPAVGGPQGARTEGSHSQVMGIIRNEFAQPGCKAIGGSMEFFPGYVDQWETEQEVECCVRLFVL